MDWSYELLSEAERLLLVRLSVFVGGWTLEAAEAVGAGNGIEADTTLDLLGGLVSKSLVSAHEQAGGETRYGLLETVRQYAAERLTEIDDIGGLRDRHLDWCLSLAERAEPEVKGPEQGEWLARLEIEHDNLQAALGWAHEREAGDLGLRLAGALSGFWYMRGHFAEGRRRLAAALADDSRGSPAARAKALNGAGLLAHQQSEYNQATALFEESLALRRMFGDQHGIAQALNNLGMAADVQGDYERAAIFYEESLAIARALGDKWIIAVSLDNLGLLADEQGRFERAMVLHEESLSLRRELGDRLGIAGSLGNLGLCMQKQGHYERARALHEESLVIRRELGQRWAIAIGLGNLGVTAYRQGDYERAATFYQESLAIDRELGSHLGIADSLGGLGWVAYRQGDLTRAMDLFSESLRLSQELGAKDFQADLLEGLAWVAGANEQPRRAAQLGGAAEALREMLGAPLTPFMHDGHDWMLRDIGASLGTDAGSHLWIVGHTLSTEQAIALALSPHLDPETASTG
jgi:tetratricopeptide (TPR) repeat protein